MSESDLELIEDLPLIAIWGEGLEDIEDIKSYKGKFVVTDDGKFFAKLFPKEEWDNIEFFHDMVLMELGVKDAKSMDVKEVIIGGGKIEVELMGDYVECRLYGKSTIYGDYESTTIDIDVLETEIRDAFDLDDIPITIILDYEEM